MTTIDGVMVLIPPPEGYVVDFDNPLRQGVPDAYLVAGFGLAISFLFFMQRMYVKIFLTGGLQVDDCKFFFFSTHHFSLVLLVHQRLTSIEFAGSARMLLT